MLQAWAAKGYKIHSLHPGTWNVYLQVYQEKKKKKKREKMGRPILERQYVCPVARQSTMPFMKIAINFTISNKSCFPHPYMIYWWQYCIRIRTRGGIYSQIYPFAWRSSRGQSLRELLKAMGVYLTVYPESSPYTDSISF